MKEKVTFLDDNEDLRIIVEKLLESQLDVKCISVSDVDDLINHADEVLESSLTILDINLGKDQSGLDAYNWLDQHHYKGKVLFLTGYDSSNPLVARAFERGVEVYQKPLGTKKLISLVNHALHH